MEIEEKEASGTSSKQNLIRKKERERIRARRAKRTAAEKAEANAKARVAMGEKRAKMTPEEQDKSRADNTAARSQKRAKMTSEERDKAKAKVKEANMKRRKKREEFCRGRISDEKRELHTVWILDKVEDGEYGPVAKLMFSEEVYEEDEGQGGRKFHRGKSKFVLVKSKPDKDDSDFIKKR